MVEPTKRNIAVAGANGYLGRHLVVELHRRGHRVVALVRPGADVSAFDSAVQIRRVEATRPETLQGAFAGCDGVISCLGLTRQKDRLRYRDVDYQANVNLLDAAQSQGIGWFGYVHALVRGRPNSELIAAKARFVEVLKAAPVHSRVYRPSGFFVDLEVVFDMAKTGRVWAIGDGSVRLNPIDGADLAVVIADSLMGADQDTEIGGPEVLSLDDISKLAFEALGRTTRITHLPRGLMQGGLYLLKPLLPRHIWGPFEFFLAASAVDAIGPSYGGRRLGDHFKALAQQARQNKKGRR